MYIPGYLITEEYVYAFYFSMCMYIINTIRRMVDKSIKQFNIVLNPSSMKLNT